MVLKPTLRRVAERFRRKPVGPKEIAPTQTNYKPNTNTTKETIFKLFADRQPLGVILAQIHTLPDAKSKAQICRGLAQRYRSLRTKENIKTSWQLDRLAKDFEQGKALGITHMH